MTTEQKSFKETLADFLIEPALKSSVFPNLNTRQEFYSLCDDLNKAVNNTWCEFSFVTATESRAMLEMLEEARAIAARIEAADAQHFQEA